MAGGEKPTPVNVQVVSGNYFSLLGVRPAIGRSFFPKKTGTRARARLRFFKYDKSAGGIGYVAAETRYLNWQPWLDFQFHRVALSSGRIFNTN